MDDSRETLQPDDTVLPDEEDPDQPFFPDDEELDSKEALPDWVYEETVSRLFRVNPEGLLKILGVPITDSFEVLPMPGLLNPQPTGIQLIRLPDGRCAEVHCVHTVPKGLVATMAGHKKALRQAFPVDHLEQYVVVLGDGELRGPDDPAHTGVYFGLRLVYLRDIEKEWFSTSTGFALLARSQTAPWASQILEAAGATVEPFVVPPNPCADIFAESDEKQATLPSRLTSLFFAGRFGPHPEISDENRTRGWGGAVLMALALHTITRFDDMRGRIARREGIADVLGDVLRERFGEHPKLSLLAYRLAALTDLDAVIQIIAATENLDDLYSKYLEH
jgi:hypothetical protein